MATINLRIFSNAQKLTELSIFSKKAAKTRKTWQKAPFFGAIHVPMEADFPADIHFGVSVTMTDRGVTPISAPCDHLELRLPNSRLLDFDKLVR